VQLIGVRPGERCGIGNVTFLSPLSSAQGAIAFNTGPGNMLIDYCVSRASAGALTFDRDGALAARGALSKPRATCRLPTRRRCWHVAMAK
jgi:1,6-anhydro-N-acetylmuramate kinase